MSVPYYSKKRIKKQHVNLNSVDIIIIIIIIV